MMTRAQRRRKNKKLRLTAEQENMLRGTPSVDIMNTDCEPTVEIAEIDYTPTVDNPDTEMDVETADIANDMLEAERAGLVDDICLFYELRRLRDVAANINFVNSTTLETDYIYDPSEASLNSIISQIGEHVEMCAAKGIRPFSIETQIECINVARATVVDDQSEATTFIDSDDETKERKGTKTDREEQTETNEDGQEIEITDYGFQKDHYVRAIVMAEQQKKLLLVKQKLAALEELTETGDTGNRNRKKLGRYYVEQSMLEAEIHGSSLFHEKDVIWALSGFDDGTEKWYLALVTEPMDNLILVQKGITEDFIKTYCLPDNIDVVLEMLNGNCNSKQWLVWMITGKFVFMSKGQIVVGQPTIQPFYKYMVAEGTSMTKISKIRATMVFGRPSKVLAVASLRVRK